ncbi:MAG: pyridoxal phosphate-dependent aminotransferase [Bacteroidales bacterium]|nr:pyridoxal phosphate-dependent aminotransferase [Bacteroidales bacterium]MBP5782236.1 pyridoxal phosphate-dependent aminotransferase [Bacteroidales bacterium]MBR5651494.1 pyridoxal phosphate-dependent aminotransferase [Bacteroidales bacterium]MBR5720374.1 pyridoxal phosphate-dependent aminotransferase [Bacteroidales bacterium]
MPKISQKAQDMPASPIRKLVPYADAAKSRGIKVYHLNIGQPDIQTPQVMLDALKNYDEKVIAYSHSAGYIEYRKVLVDYYKSINIDITPDNIIVTNGASEAIMFAMQVCMDDDDEIIIPEPFYANYNGFAKSSGIKVVPINSHIEDGFALPPISEFEKVITPHTKAIMICNPNNPTGYLYSKEELLTLRDIALKYDLFIFADEVYREFCYDGNKHFSVMHLEGLDNNVVLFDSVSKRYSACGFRVGCMISKNKELMAAAMKFAQARLSPPSFGQIAAEASNKVPKEYFKDVLEEYDERRMIIYNEINKMEGAFCPKPKGAFYIVAHLPIDDADKFCKWLLEDFSADGETVMLAPATGFYSTPGSGKQEVRISYVLKCEDLKKAMHCLDEALKVYPGRTL